MALVRLSSPGTNTPVLSGSAYEDTEAGIDFLKKGATVSTVGGDVEQDGGKPVLTGTVTAFSVEGDKFDFSVEDVSMEASQFKGKLDAVWWSGALYGDDTVIGSSGADSLSGWGGDDQLFGGAGRDKLYGGEGDDALFGGKGRDYLHGWKGDNGLYGGGGGDTFFIDKGTNYIETGRGADDVILDFKAGRGTVADFSLGSDQVYLLAPASKDPPSVQDLIDSGDLKISGDASHTLIRFGGARLDLLHVSIDDFSADMLSVV